MANEEELLNEIERKDLIIEVFGEVVEELREMAKVDIGTYSKMWTHHLMGINNKKTESQNDL